MVKRALLVGCNYPGSQSELRGCVNDVHAMKKMLLTHFGFEDSNIHVYIDTDSSHTQPTGANIKSGLGKLVRESKDGDVLVFHFSGHGTQVKDHTGEEADNMDEAICPCDMNLICDDDFRVLLKPLPIGCKFTMVTDCCHSGTLLDHAEQQISGNKDPNAPQGIHGLDASSLMGMFFKGGDQTKDIKNRSLSPDNFCKAFNQIHNTDMVPGSMKNVLLSKFGTHATKMLESKMGKQAIDMAMKYMNAATSGGGSGGGSSSSSNGKAGLMNKLLGMCLSSSSGGGGNTGSGNSGGPSAEDLGATLTPNTQGAPPKLEDDKGILITGCQSNETSADACPSGDPKKAFGALTNALTTCVEQAMGGGGGVKYTYSQLVYDVREALLKTGFKQNPCLECSDKNANEPVIVL